MKGHPTDPKVMFNLLKALDESLERVDDKHVKYCINGVSDGSLAVRFGLTEQVVAAARTKTFGRMQTGGGPGSIPAYHDLVLRVGDTMKRLEAAEKRIDALEDYHTRTMKTEHEKQQRLRGFEEMKAALNGPKPL